MEQKGNAWIHIPQSFCGRINEATTTSRNTAGICTFGFTSCNIVVIAYKTQNKILKSLIHFDGFNHPFIITNEVKYYQKRYPNGICKIYIIKKDIYQSSFATDKIKSASIFTDKTVTYEIICVSKEVHGIGIWNNSNKSLYYITQDPSDFNLISHPDEWQLVLERKVIVRIASIKIQNTFSCTEIFNGKYWSNINQLNKKNKKYKKIYQLLKHFLDSFTFDTPLGDIIQSLESIILKQIKKNKEFVSTETEISDFIVIGAVCTKVLKGFQKYENKNFILTKILHEICQALINTLQSNGNIKFMNMVQAYEIPIDEKMSVISCCKDMLNKNIDKINRSKILEICGNYFIINNVFVLQFHHYMSDKKSELLMNQLKEYETNALQNYMKDEFTTAKKIFWKCLIHAEYLYYSPSHDLATAYYNYGASCHNASDKVRALSWLDIANTMNKEIPDDQRKNERKNKIAKRLAKLL